MLFFVGQQLDSLSSKAAAAASHTPHISDMPHQWAELISFLLFSHVFKCFLIISIFSEKAAVFLSHSFSFTHSLDFLFLFYCHLPSFLKKYVWKGSLAEIMTCKIKSIFGLDMRMEKNTWNIEMKLFKLRISDHCILKTAHNRNK